MLLTMGWIIKYSASNSKGCFFYSVRVRLYKVENFERTYVQQSSPGQTEGLKDGWGAQGYEGHEVKKKGGKLPCLLLGRIFFKIFCYEVIAKQKENAAQYLLLLVPFIPR